MSNQFFGDYVPTSSNQDFIKLTSGTTRRFRIMSLPFICLEAWDEAGKPKRSRQASDLQGLRDQKTLMSFMVWDFENECPGVWSISQKGIQRTIYNLSSDLDYGDPRGYDLKVTKQGSGMETNYSLIPGPIVGLSNEIKVQFKNITLDWDLFLKGEGSPIVRAADKPTDLPF